jgi:hypothetical protein
MNSESNSQNSQVGGIVDQAMAAIFLKSLSSSFFTGQPVTADV